MTSVVRRPPRRLKGMATPETAGRVLRGVGERPGGAVHCWRLGHFTSVSPRQLHHIAGTKE
ncbi:hypothetical protein E2C01_055250 [Portunus trituberculatus]|uniref:Uncharacterized protein n=1 Tax=Portunus trituberculatus TaxID=210409 RepID=A0A5B7GX52_PORTR|nr:hypothetical protein [Portunus trituberculatus]